MFYLVSGLYNPNTAPTNRIMAYVKALSELGLDTEVVFFFPDNRYEKASHRYPHISFTYLWEQFFIDIPKIRVLFIRHNITRFIQQLKKGDIVYVYGFPDLVKALSPINDIRVFSEITEHPQASFVNFINHTTIAEYIECIKTIEGVVVISNALKQYLIEQGCDPERVHVINMTVDKMRFENVQKNKVEPYVAYCGTATNTKDGVDQLIKAFAIVVKSYPDYKLYIIGSTPSKKQRFGNLELAKELGIENNVVFTGVVPAQEMPQILKNAEILALDRPDNLQAKYGFPTKLGEYLLTGNPVVVTRVGDIPLFLEHGKSALIAEPENPQDFAEKICWAIKNSEESRLIGARGKQVAESSFDSMIETKKLVSILNRKT